MNVSAEDSPAAMKKAEGEVRSGDRCLTHILGGENSLGGAIRLSNANLQQQGPRVPFPA